MIAFGDGIELLPANFRFGESRGRNSFLSPSPAFCHDRAAPQIVRFPLAASVKG
jgi:hypothetical protein